jgi:cell wall-associated NlpC family hydrolase
VIPETQDTIVGAEQLARRFPADPRAVVQTAGRWLGVPYLWGGRTNTGSDCSGFVQSILRVHGVLLPRDSKDQGAGGEALGDSAHALDDVRPGDLLFFAPEGRGISHVAISTGGTGIIHCSAGRGEVAEDDLSAEPSSDELQRLLRKSLVCTTMPLTGAGQAG